MGCDVKLMGAEVVDGTGAPAFTADLAIEEGRITAIGELADLEAATTLDLASKTLTPGFIDIHSHSDFLVPGADHGALVEPFLRQGITTLVAGNCGFSPAPVTETSRSAVVDASLLIGDEPLDLRWNSMGQFLDRLETSGVAMNVAQLVGHGSVRAAVSGHLTSAPPSAGELEQMERHVSEALEAGCVGISTGLGYPPGIFAKPDELELFASWAAREDKLFTSHLRAYSWVSPTFQVDPAVTPHNIAAIEEVLEVARKAEVKLQLSHLIFVGRNTWRTHDHALSVIEAARDAGLDVAFDAFPYTAGNTTASVIFPPEMLPHLESVLEDSATMADLIELGDGFFGSVGLSLRDIQIMNANAPAFDRYNGMFVGAAAEEAGMDIWEFYGLMVVASRRMARVLIHAYSGDAEDESALRAVLAHPLCTVETDTFLTENGHQNPASFGTFPRVLATYVEEGLFGFEEAVRKMTGAAAERLGWSHRGFVREGAPADLVVLDRGTLTDTATFDAPSQFPVGIERVFVNGRPVVDGDAYDAAAHAGHVLRG